jgi:hypothetical protein
MTLTTHATARLPLDAPSGQLRDPALRDQEFAARDDVLSCKRNGLGMSAAENDAPHATEDLAPLGDGH